MTMTMTRTTTRTRTIDIGAGRRGNAGRLEGTSMQERILAELVAAFNRRDFRRAAGHAAEGLLRAKGRDEVFWMGLGEACEGFGCLLDDRADAAEQHLMVAMHNLRNFGYSYQGFQITPLLAGLRRGAEEIRVVRSRHKRVFDITLLPQLRLAVKEQQNV